MKDTRDYIIPAPVDAVMDLYADGEFYAAKLKNSGALTVELLVHEERPDGTKFMRAQGTEPTRVPNVPGLRKSDVDTFIDENVLDRAARKLTWKVIPEIMADKFFLYGHMEFHSAPGDATRVVFNTIMEIKIPFIGKKAEKIGLSKTAEEVERQVTFVKRWLQEHA